MATAKSRPRAKRPPPQAEVEVSRVVDHLFRHEAGRMIAILTRIFGIEHLHLAEDVVQEALLKALQVWSFGRIPQNPSAWIMRVAKNLALDVVRREQVFRNKEREIISVIEGAGDDRSSEKALRFENEIKDDQLRMMFTCCHPLLSSEVQVALTLKTLCGFSIPEIARAFLTSEAAMAKKLVRARQRIREANIPFEIPAGEELVARLDSVLQTLYLLFNEGYKASQGDDLVRQDLCWEAIRLTTLLVEHPAGDQARTRALLALMLLTGARLPARVDSDGNLLLLEEQDRSRWDKAMMRQGLHHLNLSAAGKELSEFHLEAGIAACHCTAESFEATDWNRILLLYDWLIQINESPVVALNRAVAVSRVHGPEAGMTTINQIRAQPTLDSYHLLHAVKGQLYWELKDPSNAAIQFRRALGLTPLKSERALLLKRLKRCEEARGLSRGHDHRSA